MSEIDKLYENAGIEPDINYICDIEPCGSRSYDIIKGYPEFTAEKQIELIKLLAKGEVKINNEDGEYEFSDVDVVSDFSSFKESLADFTNRIWQYLTEEEKQQVRNILNE